MLALIHTVRPAPIGRHVRVMSAVPDQPQTDAFTPAFAIPPDGAVELRVEIDDASLRFAYRVWGLNGVDVLDRVRVRLEQSGSTLVRDDNVTQL